LKQLLATKTQVNQTQTKVNQDLERTNPFENAAKTVQEFPFE